MLHVTIREHSLIWRFKSTRMWHCVFWWLVLNILKNHGALISTIKQPHKTYQTAWTWQWGHHDPQNIGNHSLNATVSYPRRLKNPQQCQCEKLKSHIIQFAFCTLHLLTVPIYYFFNTFTCHPSSKMCSWSSHIPDSKFYQQARWFCIKYKLVIHPSEMGACMACWFVKCNPVSSLYDHCAINFLLSNTSM